MFSFIEHIPQAILENILLMGLCFALYKCIEIQSSWKANAKYSLAVFLQFIGALHFIVSVSFKTTSTPIWVLPFEAHLPASIHPYLPYMGILYLMVLIGYALQLFLQMFELHEIKKSANYTLHEELMNSFKKDTPHLPAHFKIGTSSKIQTPIVFGFFEPIILLPVAICTYLSLEQIKLVLLHELAHIQRNDFLIQILLRLAQCIVWFNPFAHAMHRSIELQREMSCDELVMNQTQAPLTYSKTLYQLASQVVNTRSHLSLGVASSNPDLLLRIQYVNGTPVTYSKKISLHFLLWLFVAAVFFMFPFRGSMNQLPSNLVNKHVKIDQPLSYQSTKRLLPSPTIQSVSAVKSLSLQPAAPTFYIPDSNTFNGELAMIPSMVVNNPSNELVHYKDLVKQTREWIQTKDNPVSYAGLVEKTKSQDSLENAIVERLVLSAILKDYQLKKALLEQKMAQATYAKEASDYLLNSKEWAEIVQYEKWAREYLRKQ